LFGAPREEATIVEYREHGTTQWRPLPALVLTRHYENSSFLDPGVGSVYEIDLAAVSGELLGAVDLHISVVDKSGNRSEMRLEPAFVVSSGNPRRRSVQH
jgi:hypothetical protein